METQAIRVNRTEAEELSTEELKARATAIDRVQAIIEFDPEGTILFANENFLKTLGYRLDEIQGRHHRIFCDPQYVKSPEYRAFWDKLGRGHYDAGEYSVSPRMAAKFGSRLRTTPFLIPKGVQRRSSSTQPM